MSRLWRELVEIQSELIRGGTARPLLDKLLPLLLEAARSTHGFIGEVRPTPDANPRFEVLVTHPSSWTEPLREVPLALLQRALETGQPASSSELWVLPLRRGDELLGLVGIAAPQGSSNTELLPQLEPALTAGANLLLGWRNEQRRQAQEEEHRLQLANLEQLKQAFASVEEDLRDDQGNPVRVMGTDVDITARKHNEERLAALIRAIPDLLFRVRVDGTIIDWNNEAPEPTALPPKTFLGKKLQELPLPPSFIESMLAIVQRVIREGSLVVYEYELEKQDRGTQRYEARVVRSGPDEAVAISRNITERKLVEERQLQLIRAEKLASLGQLAAGIAHEINNPVGYVTSNLKTLEQYATRLVPLLKLQGELLEGEDSEARVPSPEQRALLRELWKQADVENLLLEMPEVIQESLTGAQRIKEIAQSLRSFSREDDARPQVVDLNAELESTLRMVWNELKHKCDVKRDFGALPPVTCYPTQITQVFTNLLINAAHSIETQGEIRIRTSRKANEVVVEISDTGMGMTQETLARLFTPFFTTKPRGQGTGLGLSISRDIISRHGGHIEVQSEPGQGSTFTVYLPAAPENLAKPTT